MAGSPEKWHQSLSADEVAELIAAARAFLAEGREIGQMRACDFPLPQLAAKLSDLQQDLRDGCGVRVITGLPVENLSRAEAAAVFCGIGSHLGSARSQNAQGHILGHVRDVGADPNDANTRIYQTHERQTFHTDSADVVGLLCLKTARKGGRSLLVSAETIFNRMLETAPDLVGSLFEPVATDRRGEVPDGEDPWFEIPVLNWHAGKLTVIYQRQYIESAQRFEHAPKLTMTQRKALDMFDILANDPELHFAMDLAPGDMQFVYNHSQLHDRTAFVDWPEPENRRHLLRLWLSLPGDRELPPVFKQRYGALDVGNRGGIIVPGAALNAPLD